MAPYVPFLTWRFDLALQFASGLHHNQARKGLHPLHCPAALLHDSVEDQGGLATLETIRHLFGQRVAAAVESCSDSTVSDPTKKLPWRDRKEKYLAHLCDANADAVIVGAADKLHNARAILSDYRQIGEELWSRFSVPKPAQFWYYGALVEAFKQTTGPRMFVDELERVVNELRAECE